MATLKKQLRELVTNLCSFNNSMLHKFLRQYDDKGLSFEGCDKDYLITRLKEHLTAENWIDVANYAFLLEKYS